MESFALPSSYSASVQYRDCFRDAGFEARYVARDRPEGFDQHDRMANWASRLRMHRKAQQMKAEIRKQWDDAIVSLAATCDVVYAIKVISLSLHQRILALDKPRLLICFADAFWLPFAQREGWQDLDQILTIAHGVVCVNEYTARYARTKNERVFIVNDSPQTEDFDRYRGEIAKNPLKTTIGWIGSPLTAGSLFKIWEPLEEIFATFPDVHLRLVGTGRSNLYNLPRFEKVRWSSVPDYDQLGMIREVLAMDIGLFPLYRGDDSLARGPQKASVYMSGEAAVVAQRYAENGDLITDGVNGMLADGDQEWYDKIAFLIRDAEARKRIAYAGLLTVRERFSRARTFEQLRHAIENV